MSETGKHNNIILVRHRKHEFLGLLSRIIESFHTIRYHDHYTVGKERAGGRGVVFSRDRSSGIKSSDITVTSEVTCGGCRPIIPANPVRHTYLFLLEFPRAIGRRRRFPLKDQRIYERIMLL